MAPDESIPAPAPVQVCPKCDRHCRASTTDPDAWICDACGLIGVPEAEPDEAPPAAEKPAPKVRRRKGKESPS